VNPSKHHLALTRFRWAIGAGFLLANLFALPGIFVPGAVLSLLKVQLTTQPVWPAFAFLLTFLVSLFFIPAAINPVRNLPTAIVSVASWFVVALYWAIFYPRMSGDSAPHVVVLVALAMGLLQAALLIQVVRQWLVAQLST